MKQETTGAWIALNNNRLKIYQDKQVYLANDDQFEIELFNGETTEVLAQIWLNDELISNSGLVLKPGQRFYLDRHIDNDRKLKFSTYQVEDSTEVRQAIKNNGKLKVQFFRKQELTIPLWKSDWAKMNPINEPYIPNWQQPCYMGDNTGDIQFNTLNTTNTTIGQNTSIHPTYSTNSLETGRIESGDVSEQQFKVTDMTFNQLAFQTSTYIILPKSTKPVETKNIRNYCNECGTRIRKSSWKFCPSCGERLD